MEKLVFKNMYLNLIFGGLLIILSLVGFFLHLFDDFIYIFIAVVLVLLSIKRFIYSFKKITSKNATLILVIELVMDLALGGLLIYLSDYVTIFIGLIIYIRGVSYLLINYIATRKIRITQYIFNIGFVTFGAFLMFTGIDLENSLVLGVSFLVLLVGAIYFQSGMRALVIKEEKEDAEKKEINSEIKKLKSKEKEVGKIVQQKDKIEELEQKVKTIEQNSKVVEKKNVALQKKQTIIDKKEDLKAVEESYEKKTVVALRAIAKEKNIPGYTQLKKAELINELNKLKK